jgi:hypothetical protein
VFYWTGRLPDISLLAITSAINKTNNAKVIVFLDCDDGFESSVPNHFDWLRSHPRFKFVDFRLSEWVYSANAKPKSVVLSKARRLLEKANMAATAAMDTRNRFMARTP